MHSITTSSHKNKFQRLWVFFQIQILGFSKLIYIFTNDIANYRGALSAPTQKEMELYEKMVSNFNILCEFTSSYMESYPLINIS